MDRRYSTPVPGIGPQRRRRAVPGLRPGPGPRACAKGNCSASPGSWSTSTTAELYIGEQLQRVSRQLLRRQTKTEASEAPAPPPRPVRHRAQAPQAAAGQPIVSAPADAWIDTGLVFTTRHGTPIEPRNFTRSFDRRIVRGRMYPRSPCTAPGRRAGPLLAALDVHPRVAMQILRHSKIAITMEIYTEVPSAATRAALQEARAVAGRDSHLTSLLHFAAAPRSTRAAFVIRLGSLTCGGAKGTRTPGLLDANQTLFQLSYSPGCLPTRVPGACWLDRIPGQGEAEAHRHPGRGGHGR